MVSLKNSTKHLKRINTSYIQSLPEKKKSWENFPTHSVKLVLQKLDKDSTKKRRLQTNTNHEYRCIMINCALF